MILDLTLAEPLLGLTDSFPDRVYVLHHPDTDRYGCFRHETIHGVAGFTSEERAESFGQWIGLPGMTTLELSFDEAREVAKNRPMPVVSLMILDDLNRPLIHYVR